MKEMAISSLDLGSNSSVLDGQHERAHIASNMAADSLLQLLSHRGILYPLCFVVVAWFYSRVTSCKSLPEEIPWVGKDSRKLFAETRAHFTSFTKVRQWLGEGYAKVCLEMKCQSLMRVLTTV